MTRIADRTVWTCAALLSAFLLSSIFHQPVGWAPRALLIALAVVAAARPYDALLLFTGLVPLATMIFVLTRTGDSNVHYHEAMALAFLGGFAVRRVVAPRPNTLPSWLYASTIVLITLVLASAIVSAAILLVEEPGYRPIELLRILVTQEYLVSSNPINAAGLFAEGLLLMLAAADLSSGEPARRRDIARLLIIGAAAAASLNVFRIIALALAREESWTVFLSFLTTLRVNVHFSDLNAAGSYFAMALLIALGLVRESRPLVVACAFLIAAGLWISGSRTALLSAFIVAMVSSGAALWRGRRRVVALGALAVLAAAALTIWAYYPRERNSEANLALRIRASLARGALEMAAAQPVFGAGIGRYYLLSPPYIIREYGKPRENAHNNFLQVLAELGVTGLLMFVCVILLALREGLRAARSSPVSAGLLAGVATYLITCFAGHPLLVDAAAYPFWIALALLATPAAPAEAARRHSLVLVAVGVAVIAASLPLRLSRADDQANLENASAGFSLWQREPDGSRYRWAGGRSSFFAPASATAVRIRLRAGAAASSTVEVQISIDERKADRVVVEPGGEWINVRLLLPRRTSGRFAKVDLEAFIRGAPRPADAKPTDANGLLMVGRPEFEDPVKDSK